MSLLNNNFIGSDGSPITGRVPTQLIVKSDPSSGDVIELTPALYSAVCHAYKLFCDAVRVSAFADGYHVQNRDFQDGSKARFESNGGVHRAMVWPVGEDGLFKHPTFFCIPYDESYMIDTPETKACPTWRINRWKDASKPEFGNPLENLKESKLEFASKEKKSHPGNQTWYAHIPGAAKPHKHADYVLSWWGQLRRYVEESLYVDSAMDYRPEQHYLGGGWGLNRRSDGYPNFYTKSYPNGNTPPITIPNELRSKPPGVDISLSGAGADYEGTFEPGADERAFKDYAWLNGMRFKVPAEIHSMCIGERVVGTEKQSVIRVLSIDTGAATVTVHEISLKRVVEGLLKGGEEFEGWESYTSSSINSVLPDGWAMYSCKHPAYWNAAGTKCTGIYKPRKPFGDPSLNLFMYSEGCAITFTAESSGEAGEVVGTITPSLERNTTYSATHTEDHGSDSETTQDGNNSTSTSSEWAMANGAMSGSVPIACDYRGDELQLLTTHISGHANHRYDADSYDETLREEDLDQAFKTNVHCWGSWVMYYGATGGGSWDVILPDRFGNNFQAPGLRKRIHRAKGNATFNGTYTTSLQLSGVVLEENTKTITAKGDGKDEYAKTWSSSLALGEGTSVEKFEMGRLIEPHEASIPGNLYQEWDNTYYNYSNMGKSVWFTVTPQHVVRTDEYSGFENEVRKTVDVTVSGYTYRYEILAGDLRAKLFTVARNGVNISFMYPPQFHSDGAGIVAGSGRVTFASKLSQAPYKGTQKLHFLQNPGCSEGIEWHPSTYDPPVEDEVLKEWTECSGAGFSVSGATGVCLVKNDAVSLIEAHSFNFLEKELPTSPPHSGSEPTLVGWRRNGGDGEWGSGFFDFSLNPNGLDPATDDPVGGLLADGAAQDIKTVFASSASSPDGKQAYIHLSTTLGPNPTEFSPEGNYHLKFVHYDQWFVNGQPVTADAPYPQTGAQKGLSSPVFVGPLPPKKGTTL